MGALDVIIGVAAPLILTGLCLGFFLVKRAWRSSGASSDGSDQASSEKHPTVDVESASNLTDAFNASVTEITGTVPPPLTTGRSFERSERASENEAAEEQNLIAELALAKSGSGSVKGSFRSSSGGRCRDMQGGEDASAVSKATEELGAASPPAHSRARSVTAAAALARARSLPVRQQSARVQSLLGDELYRNALSPLHGVLVSPIASWNVDKVCAWLISINPALDKYVEAFRSNQVDGAALQCLGSAELKTLGVTSIGHQIAIMTALAQQFGRERLPSSPAPITSAGTSSMQGQLKEKSEQLRI